MNRRPTGRSRVAVISTWHRNSESSQRAGTHLDAEYKQETRQRAQQPACSSMITRSFFFALTLARLRRRRKPFLNPRFPARRLAGDRPGRLIAVEVEI